MSSGEAYAKLNDNQRQEVHNIVGIVLKAVSPDDSTGHLPNCGYTNEHQICDCAEMGERLFTGLSEYVAKSSKDNNLEDPPDTNWVKTTPLSMH